LFERFGNYNASGGTDRLNRFFRLQPRVYEHTGCDQAGSANALPAVHGNILPSLELGCDMSDYFDYRFGRCR